MKKLGLIAALLLAACSGGGGGGDGGTTNMPPAEPPPTIDAFFAAVSGVVSVAPDDSEAANIDTLAATAPENGEPSAL